jgi:hypothetical protein
MKGHVSLSRTTVLLHSALREMKMPKGQSQAA